MPNKPRISTHLMLFGLAFVIFYAGLNIGLQYSPLASMLLWALAGVIVLGICSGSTGGGCRGKGRHRYMRTLRVLALALCLALIPSAAAAAECEFVLGFKAYRAFTGMK